VAIPYKVGLTGGIGCGKTTVAKLFKKLGIEIIDADDISHQLTQPGTPALDEIKATFGTEVFDSSNELNRKILRDKVFEDRTSRNKLEAILHPRVFESIEKKIQDMDTGYCILSIPLLFETNSEHLVDTILVIDCKEELQLKRILNRDGITLEIATDIISNQVNRENRLDKANEIITNNCALETLDNQVQKLHEIYTNRSLSNNQIL
jgi:dephospho-CoA kinase